MEKTYPTNLLIKLFNLYDPSMNRLDSWMDWNQQKRNKRQIKKMVQTTPLIFEVLDIALDQLDDRRKAILLARYKEKKTLSECGKEHHISAERARQLSETAINQMRQDASIPFFALIWPQTGHLTRDEWLKWVIPYCKDETGKPTAYAQLPISCKLVIANKVSKQVQDVYETAIHEGDR